MNLWNNLIRFGVKNLNESKIMHETDNSNKAEIAKLEKKIADAKHRYYSDKNLTAEKSQKIKQELGDLGRRLKRLNRLEKTGSAGYAKPSKSDAKPDFLDLDKDGNTEEPMKDAAATNKKVNEDSMQQMDVTAKPGKGTRKIVLAANGVEISTDDDTKLRNDGKIEVGTVDASYNTSYYNQTITVTGATKTQAYEIVDEATFSEMLKDANQRQLFGADVSLDNLTVTESINSMLRKNLRRFGVKNLAENAFQGEPVEPEDDTVTVYQNKFDMVNLKINGQMRQLLWMDKGKTLQQVLDMAREEEAYIPQRNQIESLRNLITPGTVVGDIWIDQGAELETMPPADANGDTNSNPTGRYVLFNLSDNSDVIVDTAQGKDVLSQHVVLLRNKPYKPTITVTPK